MAPTREWPLDFSLPWPDVPMLTHPWDGRNLSVQEFRIHKHGIFEMAYVLTNDGYAAGIIKSSISQDMREIEVIKPVFDLAPMEHLTLLMPGSISNIRYLIRAQLENGRLVSPLTLNGVNAAHSSKHFRSMVEQIFVFSFIFSCGLQPHRVLIVGNRPILTSCVALKPGRSKQVTPDSYRNMLSNQPMSELIAKYYGGTDPFTIGSRIKYRVDRMTAAMRKARISDARIQAYSHALQEGLSMGVIVDNARNMRHEVEDKLREPILITQ